MGTVYSFRVWDQAAGEFKIQPHKSTVERITRVGGQIIEDTAQEVPENEIDTEGRHTPRISPRGGFGGGVFGEAAYGEVSSSRTVIDPGPTGSSPISGGPLSGGALAEGALGEEEHSRATDRRTGQSSTATYTAPTGARFTPQGVGSATVAAGAALRRPETVLISNPQAGPAGRDNFPRGRLRPAAARSAAAQSAIRENPNDIEAMALSLAEQFEQKAEALRGRNDRSQEQDELLEFLKGTSSRLRDLADAIRSGVEGRIEDQPIFLGRAGKIADELEVGFFEALQKHRVHVWEVGALGVGVLFLSQLGLNPSEAFGYLRGIFPQK